MWHDLKKNPKDLPKEHDSIFARLKGTAKWNPHMFEKISDHVDVTVELLDGTIVFAGSDFENLKKPQIILDTKDLTGEYNSKELSEISKDLLWGIQLPFVRSS